MKPKRQVGGKSRLIYAVRSRMSVRLCVPPRRLQLSRGNFLIKTSRPRIRRRRRRRRLSTRDKVGLLFIRSSRRLIYNLRARRARVDAFRRRV